MIASNNGHQLLLQTQLERAASIRERWASSNRQVDVTHHRDDHFALAFVEQTNLQNVFTPVWTFDERLALNTMILCALEYQQRERESAAQNNQ